MIKVETLHLLQVLYFKHSTQTLLIYIGTEANDLAESSKVKSSKTILKLHMKVALLKNYLPNHQTFTI